MSNYIDYTVKNETQYDIHDKRVADGFNGILKGNGTTIAPAVAGTDYQAPLTPGTDYQTPQTTLAGYGITDAYIDDDNYIHLGAKSINPQGVQTVNGIAPVAGNVNITHVQLADNLFSPDNSVDTSSYIFRTAGGEASINNGSATLQTIKGNMTVPTHIERAATITYSSSSASATLNVGVWTASNLGKQNGSFVFTYDGSVWKYNGNTINLATYGIEVTGTVRNLDTITITISNTYSATANTTAVATAIVPSIDSATWSALSKPYGTYVYDYDGTSWKDVNHATVDFAELGITFTGTAVNKDTLTVTYLADSLTIAASRADQTYGSVNQETFFSSVLGNVSGTYEFTYNSGNWKYAGNTVTLATYGITAGGTVREGDKITITYTLTVTNSINYGSGAVTATVNADTFAGTALGGATGSYTFTKVSGNWTYGGSTVTLATYGITISGDTINGDSCTVAYTKRDYGTIVVANPTAYKTVMFNAYNHTAGYAKVKGGNRYQIFGTYTSLGFTTTIGGTTTPIIPSENVQVKSFTIPKSFIPEEDGYVYVTGGNNTDTMIALVWSGYNYNHAYVAYQESSVTIPTTDSSSVALPTATYGMPGYNGIYDELNMAGSYIQRWGRVAYTASKVQELIEAGTYHVFDETWIYYELDESITYYLTTSDQYTVDDFGTEELVGTAISMEVTTLYGSDLKNKLRTDVLTLSGTDSATAQQLTNIKNRLGIAYSNPNLLDNPWFTVNQRGAASYSGSVYSVDRWAGLNSPIVTVNADKTITITPSSTTFADIVQYISNASFISGKTVTISVDVVSFTDEAHVQTAINGTTSMLGSITKVGINSFTMNIPSNVTSFGLRIYACKTTTSNQSLNIRAAKLELGSTSTLANDSAPDYATEVVKCMGSTADSNDTYANMPMGYTGRNYPFVTLTSNTPLKPNVAYCYNPGSSLSANTTFTIDDSNLNNRISQEWRITIWAGAAVTITFVSSSGARPWYKDESATAGSENTITCEAGNIYEISINKVWDGTMLKMLYTSFKNSFVNH